MGLLSLGDSHAEAERLDWPDVVAEPAVGAGAGPVEVPRLKWGTGPVVNTGPLCIRRRLRRRWPGVIARLCR